MATVGHDSDDVERQAEYATNEYTTGTSDFTTLQGLALQRTSTLNLQHSETVGSHADERKFSLDLNIGRGRPLPAQLPSSTDYLVDFNDADDPTHPHNWPLFKKCYTGGLVAYSTVASSFGGSGWSAASGRVAEVFNVSAEVTTVGLSLYVLGFATGPIVWAPLSELYGRKVPMMLGMFGLGVFSIGCAVGKDLQTEMLCRFFGGAFGAAPLTCGAATISDLFDDSSRGVAISFFSVVAFGGPFVAPFVMGFITDSYLDWRWTQYLTALMAFFALILIVLVLPESYAPVILVSKASKLRKATKIWGIHAKQEEVEVNLKELAVKNLSRPLRLLFTEPIVLLISIYVAFIYGLLYSFLTAYPMVFQGIHGWNRGLGGLPLVGCFLGEVLAAAYLVIEQPRYLKKLTENKGRNIPEWRLPPMIVGGVLFSIGMFWFGWSGYREDIHWIAPTLSGLFTGFGVFMILLQAQNYILDAYLTFAASAIAANTFARSLAGAIFPLFASYMYQRLGIQWASTLLGCLAALMVPIPVVFYKYGHIIRKKSHFIS
ncbi:MFS multidrug transporter [Penicillium coprophilum]|uniref:MFS multidrug transporter n=1 Tax=Penicillium coprophilum TaxID=36646 RepID=UPI0023904560|nr:MFS multidrug transporter [Penicillium coprophilum]KAJ5173570.1 MFS multidrug transporter [Penicillium coprophilum]